MSTTESKLSLDSTRDLLEMLVGREVTVKYSKTDLEVNDPNPGTFGIYKLESGEIGGIVMADLAACCNLGASLSLIPSAMAEEAIAIYDFPVAFRENFYEVLNVMAQLFNASGRKRRVLSEMIRIPADLYPEEIDPILEAEDLDDLNVDLNVQGYGPGRMRLVFL